jgi:hypothetical protein
MLRAPSRSLLVAGFLLLMSSRSAGAQWQELTSGTEASQYLYAMQLYGVWGGESSALRPFGPKAVARWMRDSATAHPWAPRFVASRRRIQWLRPMAVATYGAGDFPWSYNDGALWQGVGVTTAASVGVALRFGPLSLRVEPLAFRAQNAPFALDGDTTRGRTPFADAVRPGTIDLPQRFGRTPYARLDPGQSEFRLDLGPFAAGLSTMNRNWGPGLRHALLLTGNAPGVPHLFLGTSDRWVTPIGRLNGQLYYGKASPSGYGPDADRRDRLLTGIVGSWQPRNGRGFEIGGARLYNKFWPAGGFSARTLSAPFGSFFTDLQFYFGGEADNQLLTAFARWRSEAHGIEVYGEFGRNDRSIDVRDVVVEPEQNSAWMVGAARSTHPTAGGAFWLLRGDLVNGRVGSISRLSRGQALFYEHSPVTDGHTHRGQLLGSPLLERTGGVELAIDRFTPRGRMGAMLVNRAMPSDGAEGQPSAGVRTQWALELTGVRFRGPSDLFARAGVVLDARRAPQRDRHTTYLSVGTRLGF